MIELATREDIPELRSLVLKRCDELNIDLDSGLISDPPSIDAVLRYHIRHNDAVVLVKKNEGKIVGFFVGALLPYMLDIRRHAAHEKLSGGEGIEELWEAFRDWGREKKAPVTVKGCYETTEKTRLEKL